MAKKRRYAATDTESLIAAIVRKIDPGQLTIGIPTYAIVSDKERFELTVETRASTWSWGGETITEAARQVLEEIESPDGLDGEQYVPRWRRLKRMQREVVIETLRKLGSEQRAIAAAGLIASRNDDAYAAHEMADAFMAAIEYLDFIDVDEDEHALPQPPLKAEPPLPMTQPRGQNVGPPAPAAALPPDAKHATARRDAKSESESETRAATPAAVAPPAKLPRRSRTKT